MRVSILLLNIGLTVGVAVAVLTSSLSYFAFGSTRDDTPWQRVAIQAVIVVTTIVIVILSIITDTESKGIWAVMGVCSLLLLVFMLISVVKEATFPSMFILLIVFFVLGIAALGHLSNDNPYGVTQGEVINQTLDADGSSTLQVEDCSGNVCHRGWLYFDDNVIFDYPVGSYYSDDSDNLG